MSGLQRVTNLVAAVWMNDPSRVGRNHKPGLETAALVDA